MNNRIYIFLSFVVSLLLQSCVEKTENELYSESRLSISIDNAEITTQNNIESTLVFLCSEKITTDSETGGEIIYSWEDFDSKDSGIWTKQIPLRDAGYLEGAKSIIIILNCPSTIKEKLKKCKTPKDLYNVDIERKEEEILSNHIMISKADIAWDKEKMAYINQSIEIDGKKSNSMQFMYLASKFDYKVNVGKNIALNLVTIEMKNLVRTTHIGGGFSYGEKKLKFDSSRKFKVKGEKIRPFYSYSSDWSAKAEDEIYAVITAKNPEEGKLYYYKSVLELPDKQLNPNCHFKIKINLNKYGSGNKDEPEEISSKMTVSPWIEDNIDTQLDKPDYLNVDNVFIELDDKDECAIRFESSEDLQIFGKKIEIQKAWESDSRWDKLSSVREYLDNSNQLEIKKILADEKDFKISIKPQTYSIIYSHEMKDYEIYPYHISFYVAHKSDYKKYKNIEQLRDKDAHYRKIDIYHMPAQYIYADKNSWQGVENMNIFVGASHETSFNNSMFMKAEGGFNENEQKKEIDPLGYLYLMGKDDLPENHMYKGDYVDEWGRVYERNSIGQKIFTDYEFDGKEYIKNKKGKYSIVLYKEQNTEDDGEDTYDNFDDIPPSSLVWRLKRQYNPNGYMCLERIDDTQDYNRELTSSLSKPVDPNMYVVRFKNSENGEYFIGDPRVSSGDTDKYHKTVNEENAKNIVAPQLRVSSRLGDVQSMYKRSDAEKRCKYYQEAGYPAGRWRLPTNAEMKLINEMTIEGKLPNVFYNLIDYVDENNMVIPSFILYRTYFHPLYWTGTTRSYLYLDNSTIEHRSDVTQDLNNDIAWVRCVYDEWYWGDDKLKDSEKNTYRFAPDFIYKKSKK